MNVLIPIDVFFFIIPFIIAFLFSFKYNSIRQGGGGFFPSVSDRDVYWFFAVPGTLIFSLISWGVYLKWFV